jgi:hypothetical protein
MGRGEPGIVPSLTTQLVYFRQENGIRQPGSLRLLCAKRDERTGVKDVLATTVKDVLALYVEGGHFGIEHMPA